MKDLSLIIDIREKRRKFKKGDVKKILIIREKFH